MLRRPRAGSTRYPPSIYQKRNLCCALRCAALRFAVGPPVEGAYYIFAGYHGVAALAAASACG